MNVLLIKLLIMIVFFVLQCWSVFEERCSMACLWRLVTRCRSWRNVKVHNHWCQPSFIFISIEYTPFLCLHQFEPVSISKWLRPLFPLSWKVLRTYIILVISDSFSWSFKSKLFQQGCLRIVLPDWSGSLQSVTSICCFECDVRFWSHQAS